MVFRYSHPICHQAVQPSFIRILENKVPEGGDVFWPSDVAISVHPSLTCEQQWSLSLKRLLFLFLCECEALNHTIIRFKEFTRCCIEIFQFEVTGSFQRHTKAFSMPAPLPQNVLWKASRSSTDIAEIQKLTFAVFCQGFLQKNHLNQLMFMDASCCSDSPLGNPLGWWTCCQSSGQCWPFS